VEGLRGAVATYLLGIMIGRDERSLERSVWSARACSRFRLGGVQKRRQAAALQTLRAVEADQHFRVRVHAACGAINDENGAGTTPRHGARNSFRLNRLGGPVEDTRTAKERRTVERNEFRAPTRPVSTARLILKSGMKMALAATRGPIRVPSVFHPCFIRG